MQFHRKIKIFLLWKFSKTNRYSGVLNFILEMWTTVFKTTLTTSSHIPILAIILAHFDLSILKEKRGYRGMRDTHFSKCCSPSYCKYQIQIYRNDFTDKKSRKFTNKTNFCFVITPQKKSSGVKSGERHGRSTTPLLWSNCGGTHHEESL